MLHEKLGNKKKVLQPELPLRTIGKTWFFFLHALGSTNLHSPHAYMLDLTLLQLVLNICMISENNASYFCSRCKICDDHLQTTVDRPPIPLIFCQYIRYIKCPVDPFLSIHSTWTLMFSFHGEGLDEVNSWQVGHLRNRLDSEIHTWGNKITNLLRHFNQLS